MTESSRQKYVVLPRMGVRAATGPAREDLLGLQSRLGVPMARFKSLPEPLTVLDSIQENGAKLVELDEASAESLNGPGNPLRAVPLVEYPKPDTRPHLSTLRRLQLATVQHNEVATAMRIEVRDARTSDLIEGAAVYAFSDFERNRGAQGVTDDAGQVTLQIAPGMIERLYVYGSEVYWGAFRQQIPVADITVALEPVDLAFKDLVRHYYAQSRFDTNRGVVVGVLDTGCGPHQDLRFLGGHCTVTGESDLEWQDSDNHGTHVAGLIGASGNLRGVAPGVSLRAYRVFPSDGGGATNYAILKALILASSEGCDIVNLSLGGGPFDEIVQEGIADACNQGMLPIIAAGNDGRKAVSFPAAHQFAIAVSALGRIGSFPAGSVDEADILRPPNSATDPAAFIAAFSNVGPQIALAGAGVGVLSTLPVNRYGPMSGTSMAAPVVAGAAASLLSQSPGVFGMTRDRQRSDAIRTLLLQNCVRFGFGSIYEGFGMPDPSVV